MNNSFHSFLGAVRTQLNGRICMLCTKWQKKQQVKKKKKQRVLITRCHQYIACHTNKETTYFRIEMRSCACVCVRTYKSFCLQMLFVYFKHSCDTATILVFAYESKCSKTTGSICRFWRMIFGGSYSLSNGADFVWKRKKKQFANKRNGLQEEMTLKLRYGCSYRIWFLFTDFYPMIALKGTRH